MISFVFYLPISSVSNCKHVWWHFMAFLAFIQLDNFFSIDWKSMIWVDNNTKKARICLQNKKNQLISLETARNYQVNEAMSHIARNVYLHILVPKSIFLLRCEELKPH